MDQKFYQACYTRVSEAGMEAGWRVVNTSPDIPPYMIPLFENSEKSNEGAVTKHDPDGSPLCVLKIVSDDKCVYSGRVKYGLTDDRGRSHYFSQGLFFSDPYETLKHPEDVLFISDSNYHFSVGETQVPPEQLAYDPIPTEEEIFRKYGLTSELSLKLCKCVLFPLFSGGRNSIFIKTDGTRAMARDLLYLIYHFLPYSVRSQVTASTYAKQTGSNAAFVFTDEIPVSSPYINPVTGQTNILNASWEKHLERYEFLLIYSRGMPKNADYHDRFYTLLEETLEEMGDRRLNRPEALKLAFQSIIESETGAPGDPVDYLYGWLALPVPVSDSYVAHVEKTLRNIAERKLTLPENTRTLLKKRMEEAASPALEDAYAEYWLARVSASRNAGELEKNLELLRSEKKTYDTVWGKLAQTGDPQLLSAYYLSQAQRMATDPAATFEDMTGLKCDYEIRGCTCLPEICDIFFRRCFDEARKRQRKGIHFRQVYKDFNTNARYFQDDSVIALWFPKLRDEYDLNFRKSFDKKRIPEYHEFYEPHMYGKWYPASKEFLNVYEDLERKKTGGLNSYIRSRCGQDRNNLAPEDVKSFAERLLEPALDAGMKDYAEMAFWHIYAQILERPELEFMLENGVPQVCDVDSFLLSYEQDPFWKIGENVVRIYTQYDAFMHEPECQLPLNKTIFKQLGQRAKDCQRKDPRLKDARPPLDTVSQKPTAAPTAPAKPASPVKPASPNAEEEKDNWIARIRKKARQGK